MCLADPSGNPRPRRVIELLGANGYDVDVSSYPIKDDLKFNRWFSIPSPPRHGVRYRLVRLRGQMIKTLRVLFSGHEVRDWLNDLLYRSLPLVGSLRQRDYHLLVVEDLFLLPVAFKIKKKARVIFDAREYYPRQNEESRLWRMVEAPERARLCRKYLPLCDQILTVSTGLAKEYKREFDVDATVVMSVPRYADIRPRKTYYGKVRMVHHGGTNPNRQLEKMIDIVRKLDDRFSLDMYLTGSKEHVNVLRRYAGDDDRVKIHAAVPFNRIINMLCAYDIGFYYLEPKGFNITYNLPNKLFEFIQARLAVAIGPSPGMSEIVSQYGCGIISKTFSVGCMAETINALTAETIDELKRKADLAARELCFEQESKKIMKVVKVAA